MVVHAHPVIPAEAAPPARMTLAIEGMTCASCVARVERVLKTVPGVSDASVNLVTARADVFYIGPVAAENLVAAIDRAGFVASLVPDRARLALPAGDQQAHEIDDLRFRTLSSFALALPVFLLEMGGHAFPGLHHALAGWVGEAGIGWTQAILTALILVGPGRRIIVQGLRNLYRRSPSMDSLVALGSLAAVGYSMVTLLAPQVLPQASRHIYFEAAAVVLTLILWGRLMEARAKGQTKSAITRLIGQQARIAHVDRAGIVTDVALDDLQVADVVQIRPGERVPADGMIIAGDSWVNEAMLTGEAMPVARGPGDPVTGGTINQAGALRVQITAVGSATVLARIIRMVEEAQAGKLPVQALVDRITQWFVPAVLMVSVATALLWFRFGGPDALAEALVHAVAVMIIACPCAMGLATPTSILVASGRAVELGILFRRTVALQHLASVTVMAFDKTGTLTEGKPVLTDLQVFASGFDRKTLLSVAAAVETASEHPLARAVVDAARAEALDLPAVTTFRPVPGFGVEAQVSGHRIHLGAGRFMEQLGLDLQAAEAVTKTLSADGKTLAYLAVDGALAAVLAMADVVKADAAGVLEVLGRQGVQRAMVSGDTRSTAEAIARPLALDRIIADTTPAGKVAALSGLRPSTGTLAFVGDGMNDAPALAAADIGIAVGTGTDVAIEAADVVLVSGHLAPLPTAVALSRATMRNIRQNLFWAFAYNAALIPVAAGVLRPFGGPSLSPALAAGAMAMSSVFVLANALRLRRLKPVPIPRGKA